MQIALIHEEMARLVYRDNGSSLTLEKYRHFEDGLQRLSDQYNGFLAEIVNPMTRQNPVVLTVMYVYGLA